MPATPTQLGLKRKLKAALLKAETEIVTFQPPSAGPNPPVEPISLVSAPISIESIQEEIAEKTATERTNALFDVLIEIINTECASVLARERVLQLLGEVKADLDSLTTEVTSIRSVLTRNGLS